MDLESVTICGFFIDEELEAVVGCSLRASFFPLLNTYNGDDALPKGIGLLQTKQSAIL